MRSTSPRLLLAVLALMSVAPTLARAEEPQLDAKELYRRATAQYNVGHFKEAAEAYEQVFEMHPDTALLYNIAQAYRLAGGFEEKALFFYKSYLQRTPKAPNKAEVMGRIAELERIVADKKLVQAKPPNDTVAPPIKPGETRPVDTRPEVRPSPPVSEQRATPVYKKWWLWTLVGGVVVAGVAVGLGVGLTATPTFEPNLPEGGPGSAAGLTVGF